MLDAIAPEADANSAFAAPSEELATAADQDLGGAMGEPVSVYGKIDDSLDDPDEAAPHTNGHRGSHRRGRGQR